MPEDALETMRAAFAAFGDALGTPGANIHLQEAIDWYLRIPEGSKAAAKRLAETCWTEFRKRALEVADRPGSDLETYMLWTGPAVAFRDADIGADAVNKAILVSLCRRGYELGRATRSPAYRIAFGILNPTEKAEVRAQHRHTGRERGHSQTRSSSSL